MREVFQFQPIYQERVWGGRRLETLLSRELPAGPPIGESWEIVDRPEAQSKVRGGRFYGAWPGMTPDKLDEGVDLAVATDYRRVLTEVLETREGKRLPTLFPNYAYPGPLGLFGAAPTKA